MSKRSSFFRIFLIILVMFFFNSCFEIDEWIILYEIENDLSGTITHDLKNITVSDEMLDEKDGEKGFQTAKEFISTLVTEAWVMKDPDIQTEKVDDISFNMRISAEFDNLIQALYPFLNSANMKIKRNKDVCEFYIRDIDLDDIDDNTHLIIKYSGKVLKDNAHIYDREKNTMKWELKETADKGIFFKIKLD